MSPERLFGWLLRLLPFDLRADYEADMRRDFRDQHHAATRSGPLSVLGLWRLAIADVLHTGPREHLAQLRQDAALALRSLFRHGTFTATALCTLALGIGANTAVFTVVHAVLLRPLPYPREETLVALWNRWDGTPDARLSNPELLDYQESSRTLQIAGLVPASLDLSGAGEAETLPAAVMTANLLDVLQLRPVRGRGFAAADERPNAPPVAILSDGLWRRRFGADPGIVGSAIVLDGVNTQVVGVLGPRSPIPTDLRMPAPAEILVPLTLDRAAPRGRRGGHYLLAVARLSPGASLHAAAAEMDTILERLKREYPDQHDQGHFGITLLPLRDELLGPARPVLGVLAGAVLLVLLLTCANVASLLLARAEGRRRELAVRSALGASRFRLVRQLVTEAALLALAGGLVGLAVAQASLHSIAVIAPASLPRLDEASLDAPVLAFTLLVALGAALVFGGLPALQVSRVGGGEALADAARGSSSGRGGARGILVGAQVAIAVVLLVGAGLLLKSFARLQGVPRGFESESVTAFRITAPEARYPDRDAIAGFVRRLTDEVRALPGVEVAGAGSGLPLAVGSGDWSFDVEGRARGGEKHHGAADWFVVTPGYFETLRVRLVRGRLPSEDDASGASPVLFLNQTAARQFFPGGDPVGQRVRLTRTTGAEQPWRTIAGVLGDVRHRGLDRAPRPEMYLPYGQFQHFLAGVEARGMSVVSRSSLPVDALAPALRAAVARLDPEVPVSDLRSMDAVVQGSLADRRRDLALIGAFALLALALAAVGLYGLLATVVTQRTREIGVRVALGARRGQVVGLVVGQSLRLVQAGIAVGLLTAIAGGGAIARMLFEVGPRDVGVLATVAALLLLVGFVASLLPARQAARLDAASALRHD